MSIIHALYSFVEGCELLGGSEVNADYLGSRTGQVSVDCIPGDSVITAYPDGSSIRSLQFAISSRECYGPDALQNLQNVGFFERLSDWLENSAEQNRLPNLGDGRTALSVKPISTVYILEEGTSSARYQIQCRLKYFQSADVQSSADSQANN